MRFGTLLCSLALGLCLTAEARVWTSKEGRKVEAELVSYNEATGGVILKRKDGRRFTLNVKQLSAADVDVLNNMPEEAETSSVEDAWSIAGHSAKAGTTETFTSEGQHALTYHCYYPEQYKSGEKLPVLILFSPGGNGKGIMKKFLPVGDEHHWLIVGCDKFKNNLDEDMCEEWFKEVLPGIEKNVPLNPERMYMGGMSGGAWRAYHYSAMFDRPWKGIVACGGWLGGAKYEGMDYRRKMAVAMVNGNDDNGANGWVEHDKSELKSRSCKVKVFSFDGGHVVAPSDVLSEAVEWIIRNTKD